MTTPNTNETPMQRIMRLNAERDQLYADPFVPNRLPRLAEIERELSTAWADERVARVARQHPIRDTPRLPLRQRKD